MFRPGGLVANLTKMDLDTEAENQGLETLDKKQQLRFSAMNAIRHGSTKVEA